MKKFITIVGSTLALVSLVSQFHLSALAVDTPSNFDIRSVSVTYIKNIDLLVFEQQTKGAIGNGAPKPVGQLDGAPVLGYVFPTTLKPEDVGFNPTEGIVALAVATEFATIAAANNYWKN